MLWNRAIRGADLRLATTLAVTSTCIATVSLDDRCPIRLSARDWARPARAHSPIMPRSYSKNRLFILYRQSAGMWCRKVSVRPDPCEASLCGCSQSSTSTRKVDAISMVHLPTNFGDAPKSQTDYLQLRSVPPMYPSAAAEPAKLQLAMKECRAEKAVRAAVPCTHRLCADLLPRDQRRPACSRPPRPSCVAIE